MVLSMRTVCDGDVSSASQWPTTGLRAVGITAWCVDRNFVALSFYCLTPLHNRMCAIEIEEQNRSGNAARRKKRTISKSSRRWSAARLGRTGTGAVRVKVTAAVGMAMFWKRQCPDDGDRQRLRTAACVRVRVKCVAASASEKLAADRAGCPGGLRHVPSPVRGRHLRL